MAFDAGNERAGRTTPGAANCDIFGALGSIVPLNIRETDDTHFFLHSSMSNFGYGYGPGLSPLRIPSSTSPGPFGLLGTGGQPFRHPLDSPIPGPEPGLATAHEFQLQAGSGPGLGLAQARLMEGRGHRGQGGMGVTRGGGGDETNSPHAAHPSSGREPHPHPSEALPTQRDGTGGDGDDEDEAIESDAEPVPPSGKQKKKASKKKPRSKKRDAAVSAAAEAKPRSSQYRGVTKHRRSGRWEAHIWVRGLGRQVYLGGYESEAHAAEAYDVAALKCKGKGSKALKLNYDVSRYARLMDYLDAISLEELVMAVRRQSQGFSRGTSAYRGVLAHGSGKFESRIGIPGGKHIYLGLFDREEEAARTYDRALVRMRGPTAATNFPAGDYPDELRFFHASQAVPGPAGAAPWHGDNGAGAGARVRLAAAEGVAPTGFGVEFKEEEEEVGWEVEASQSAPAGKRRRVEVEEGGHESDPSEAEGPLRHVAALARSNMREGKGEGGAAAAVAAFAAAAASQEDGHQDLGVFGAAELKAEGPSAATATAAAAAGPVPLGLTVAPFPASLFAVQAQPAGLQDSGAPCQSLSGAQGGPGPVTGAGPHTPSLHRRGFGSVQSLMDLQTPDEPGAGAGKRGASAAAAAVAASLQQLGYGGSGYGYAPVPGCGSLPGSPGSPACNMVQLGEAGQAGAAAMVRIESCGSLKMPVRPAPMPHEGPSGPAGVAQPIPGFLLGPDFDFDFGAQCSESQAQIKAKAQAEALKAVDRLFAAYR